MDSSQECYGLVKGFFHKERVLNYSYRYTDIDKYIDPHVHRFYTHRDREN